MVISIFISFTVNADIETNSVKNYSGLNWSVSGIDTSYCQAKEIRLNAIGVEDSYQYSVYGAIVCADASIAGTGTALITQVGSQQYLAISIYFTDTRLFCSLPMDTLSSSSCELIELRTNEPSLKFSMTFIP